MVELTDTSLATLSSVADHNIATLRRAGVGIAIDDFGTGYASLSYLHRIEATEIKIDRGFVAGLETAERRDSKPLIQAILSLAHALGLAVTAEASRPSGSAAGSRRRAATGCRAICWVAPCPSRPSRRPS